MKCIEQKILEDGYVINNDILKVDSFLNHQIDPKVIRDFALETKKVFSNVKVDKVLTIETSGIAVAYAVAEAFNDVPLVFAKKTKSQTTIDNYYLTKVKSFTRNETAEVIVSKRYLKKDENILIIDDFLAEGNASLGLVDLCKQAGANVAGIAVVIEKVFQGGRSSLEKMGYKVFAGASIKAFKDNKPVF